MRSTRFENVPNDRHSFSYGFVFVQGMDERNERLVFDRIVRSCCVCPCNPRKKSRIANDGGALSSSSSSTTVAVAENGVSRCDI